MTADNTLGVVMPVFNEGEWPMRALAALREASRRADWPLDVVIVDDGSGPESAAILDRLGTDPDVRVLRQPNSGRFAARLNGLRACRAHIVLMLDARLLLAPDALAALRRSVSEDPNGAWNAHVDTVIEGNLWAAFWSGLTKIWWRRYWARPRRITYGRNEFDAYPKGTGGFVAPRDLLLRTAAGFTSLYADQRLASDDTRWLRDVAGEVGITIDPGFACDYYGKDTARRWAQQCYFRGTTFVDGYLDSRRAAAVGLAGAGVLATALVAAGSRHPGLTLKAAGMGLAGGVVGGVSVAHASGARPAEVRALVTLAPAFGGIFGAGVIRGLLLAVRSRR